MNMNPNQLNQMKPGVNPIQRPQVLAKQDSKKVGRKVTPNTDKKSVQPKSPAVKKAREVMYVKLFIVQ